MATGTRMTKRDLLKNLFSSLPMLRQWMALRPTFITDLDGIFLFADYLTYRCEYALYRWFMQNPGGQPFCGMSWKEFLEFLRRSERLQALTRQSIHDALHAFSPQQFQFGLHGPIDMELMEEEEDAGDDAGEAAEGAAKESAQESAQESGEEPPDKRVTYVNVLCPVDSIVNVQYLVMLAQKEHRNRLEALGLFPTRRRHQRMMRKKGRGPRLQVLLAVMDAMKQLDFAAAFGSEENRRILEQEKIRLAWHRESAASPSAAR